MARRFPLFVLAVVAVLLSACGGSTSSADSGGENGGDAPLPTIGLGSDLSNGQISGGADIRPVGSSEIDTVVMIGDSITVASEPALRDVFTRLGFSTVDIQAQQSKRIANGSNANPSGTELAAAYVFLSEADQPDSTDHSNELWVVALGTNDISQYSNAAERAGAINQMLQIVPDEAPLIWVDTYFRDRPDDTDAINDVIVDRVEGRDDSMVARWSAVAGDDGNLRDDGIHPREQGSIVFADVVGNAIIDFLQLA